MSHEFTLRSYQGAKWHKFKARSVSRATVPQPQRSPSERSAVATPPPLPSAGVAAGRDEVTQLQPAGSLAAGQVGRPGLPGRHYTAVGPASRRVPEGVPAAGVRRGRPTTKRALFCAAPELEPMDWRQPGSSVRRRGGQAWEGPRAGAGGGRRGGC